MRLLPSFRPHATIDAETYAEAQSLLDEGMDRETVLALFGADAAWLGPLLRTAGDLQAAYETAEPSYYFEASLKAKFLAAAREAAYPAPVAVVVPSPLFRLRAAVAGLTVVTAASAAAILTLAFVTAGDAVPGDWNYTFKVANERLQYSLSHGDGRVNIQLSHTENRVYEIQRLSSRGDLSPGDVASLQREANALADLARQQPLDDVQKARLRALVETSSAVLSDPRVKRTGTEPVVTDAINAVNDAYAAGFGGGPTILPTATATGAVTATATPSPAPTITATPSPTSTPTPVATPTPTPTTPPTATPTPTPTATATPTPSPTATPTPSPTATATATATPSPSPTASPAASATP